MGCVNAKKQDFVAHFVPMPFLSCHVSKICAYNRPIIPIMLFLPVPFILFTDHASLLQTILETQSA